MSKHKVKSYHWVGGSLMSRDHHFDGLEDALRFASYYDAFQVKVYTDDGELIHDQIDPVVLEEISSSTYG